MATCPLTDHAGHPHGMQLMAGLEIYFDYLRKNIQQPCIVTGIDDFPWEEFYVFGLGDEEEYNALKKTRPSHTDHFEIIKLEDIMEI